METNTKYTKGQWVTDTSHNEYEGITIWADPTFENSHGHPNSLIIAHVVDDQHMNKEENAKLIVSAPEILEALIAALSFIPVDTPQYKKAWEAIKKATV